MKHNCALRESAESEDKVFGSGQFTVVSWEPRVWRSATGPSVPKCSSVYGWGPPVPSYCVTGGGSSGVAKSQLARTLYEVWCVLLDSVSRVAAGAALSPAIPSGICGVASTGMIPGDCTAWEVSVVPHELGDSHPTAELTALGSSPGPDRDHTVARKSTSGNTTSRGTPSAQNGTRPHSPRRYGEAIDIHS
ncbi:hypothetical protein GW17_00014783 [Ensete ventricosum]|nr:hypothetical protein GW17_00014783 [Ensete ventricosum]